MNTIHFVMMGKGGVGKSLIAVTLAQYLRSLDRPLNCIDLDPTSPTFKQFGALAVEHINIADSECNIDPTRFDVLMEKILASDTDWVIDTGAPTFLPLVNYLAENQVFSFLVASGRRVVIHSPLVGGVAMGETVSGLKAILQMSDCPVVVWENEYFGPVEMNGKRFVQTAGYEQFKKRVLGLVPLDKKNHKTAEADLRAMHARRLTWDEAINDPGFMTMQRNRLTIMRDEIAGHLNKIEL
ncbi:P-loop NTPase [Massilia aerilata]|uniref:P-loop NTPase n=1 Tax=Massilia aerilata TaxID=453817 RepID=A0ABW0S2N5_9BURK